MNIFWLDQNLEVSARFHVDSHIIKIQLEAAQLLCSALRLSDGLKTHFTDPLGKNHTLYLLPNETFTCELAESGRYRIKYSSNVYKECYLAHPCTIWASKSLDNWLLLRDYANALLEEQRYRFGSNHKSNEIINSLPVPSLPKIGVTSLPLAMPLECRLSDPYESYKSYYNLHKRHLFKWTKRSIPDFITKD